jgi:hypothetical protein
LKKKEKKTDMSMVETYGFPMEEETHVGLHRWRRPRYGSHPEISFNFHIFTRA